MAPLRELKKRGTVERILYVTWNTREIDSYVAPLAQMPDVDLMRVDQPDVKGTRYQKGVIYQVRNLEAALEYVAGDDTLVLKTRPDFVADVDFLNDKLENFGEYCAPSVFTIGDELKLPASPFRAKLWIPWADANQPFFYEDAAFAGLRCDVAKLVVPHISDKLSVLDTPHNIYGPFAHVVRFCAPFRADYPMFGRYLRDYKYFTNDMAYRKALVPALTKEPWFWTLVIVHAWILSNSFHVDSGTDGDLRLYANLSNENADWSSLASLRINPPFDNIESWRKTAKLRSLLSGAARLYGRLMDDRWQHSLFDLPGPTDIARDKIVTALDCVRLYGKRAVTEQEDSFYRTLANTHRNYFSRRAA
jgi:hypothetical protein